MAVHGHYRVEYALLSITFVNCDISILEYFVYEC